MIMNLENYRKDSSDEEIKLEIPKKLEKKESIKKKLLNLNSNKSITASRKSIIDNKKKKVSRNSVVVDITLEKKDKNERNSKTIEAEKEIEKIPNEIRKFSLMYSPRTTFSKKKIDENKLYNELSVGFDPITIKILKSHFKERLGALNKNDFIGICKNHLLTWHPDLPNREKILIKLFQKQF